MNRSRAIALCFGLMFGASGCVSTQTSERMTEEGVVVQTVLRPYHKHDYYTPATHTDTDGRTYITVEHHTDTYFEEYWVIFACQHGQFAIDSADLWRKLTPGMKVSISYRTLDFFKKQKGVNVHVGTDYQFENAEPIDPEWNASAVQRTVKDARRWLGN